VKPTFHVKVDLSPLAKFTRAIRRAELVDDPGNPFAIMFKQWGARYLAFARRRFVKMSRGGWPRLKRARRHRRGRRERAAVLRDTGTLFGALTPGAPGNEFRRIPRAIRVGYGGPHRHPKGRATIADIASFHQTGAGHLPKREIIVPPDQRTIRGMIRDGKRALRRLAEMCEGR